MKGSNVAPLARWGTSEKPGRKDWIFKYAYLFIRTYALLSCSECWLWGPAPCVTRAWCGISFIKYWGSRKPARLISLGQVCRFPGSCLRKFRKKRVRGELRCCEKSNDVSKDLRIIYREALYDGNINFANQLQDNWRPGFRFHGNLSVQCDIGKIILTIYLTNYYLTIQR